ncbi:MAG: hypothetical protein WC527_08145 [Candidatus Margulisiibacteriota bacterium]
MQIEATRAKLRTTFAKLAAPYSSFESYGRQKVSRSASGSQEYLTVLSNIGRAIPKYSRLKHPHDFWETQTGNDLNMAMFSIMEEKDKGTLPERCAMIAEEIPSPLKPEVATMNHLLLNGKHQCLFEGTHSVIKISAEGVPFILDIASGLFVPEALRSDYLWSIIPWSIIIQNPGTFYMYTGGHQNKMHLSANYVASDARSYYERRKAEDLPFCSEDAAECKSASDFYHFLVRREEGVIHFDERFLEFTKSLNGLSDESLDRQIADLSGCSLPASRMMSGKLFHLVWKPAQLSLLNRTASNEQETAAFKIFLLCREWAARYLPAEEEFERTLPYESRLEDNAPIADKLVGGFSTIARKNSAIIYSGLTDDGLISELSIFSGKKHNLRKLTCEDILMEIYRPAFKKLRDKLARCQSGSIKEKEYMEERNEFFKLELLLKEWFYRHAWVQATPFPSREEETRDAFCAEELFEQDAISQYFPLYMSGIVRIFHSFLENERHLTLLKIFKAAGIGPGSLVADIGCGASHDIPLICSGMGAQVIAYDINFGNQIKDHYRPEIWEALVAADYLKEDGSPTNRFWKEWREYTNVEIMRRGEFKFDIPFDLGEMAISIGQKIEFDYVTGAMHAKKKIEQILFGAPLLPSQQKANTAIFNRTRWVTGEQAHVMNVSLPRPARAIIINGVIDVGGHGNMCFGPGAPLFSSNEVTSILERMVNMLEPGGNLFVGTFQESCVASRYSDLLSVFASSHPGIAFDGRYKEIPRDSESMVWGGPRSGQMFVLKKNTD